MSLRASLSAALSLGAVFAALAACFLQNSNHARAEELSRMQRQWEMVAAANAQMRARVESHVPGVSNDELDATVRASGEKGGEL